MEVNGIGPISTAQPVRRAAPPPASQPPHEPRPVSPKDQLEISSVNAASPADLQSEFRAQRIAQIQQQIADGTYETADRLDATVDRLLTRLLSE